MSIQLPPHFLTVPGQGRTLAALEETVCSHFRIRSFSEGVAGNISLVLYDPEDETEPSFYDVPASERERFYEAMGIDPQSWQRELVDRTVDAYRKGAAVVAIAPGLPPEHEDFVRVRRLSSRAYHRPTEPGQD